MDNITKYDLASLTFTLLMQLPILDFPDSRIIFQITVSFLVDSTLQLFVQRLNTAMLKTSKISLFYLPYYSFP